MSGSSQSDADPGPWLSPRDAGDLVGKSDQAIIEWIKKGDFAQGEWRQENDRYAVRQNAVLLVAGKKSRPRRRRSVPTGDPIGETTSPAMNTELDDLQGRIKELSRDLQDAIDDRDRLRAENHLLHQTAKDLHTALGRYL